MEPSKTNVEKVVYTVADIQALLGIGRQQAYELVNSGQFPIRRMGKKILIAKKTFNAWLYDKAAE